MSACLWWVDLWAGLGGGSELEDPSQMWVAPSTGRALDCKQLRKPAEHKQASKQESTDLFSLFLTVDVMF